jgi:hypothetical protein
LEDSNNASEVRLDAQLREIAQLTRDHRTLTKVNEDLKTKIKEVKLNLLDDKLMLLRQPLDNTDPKEQRKYEQALLEQITKLKRDKRALITDKIKLDSEIVSLTLQKEIQMEAKTADQMKALETQLKMVFSDPSLIP